MHVCVLVIYGSKKAHYRQMRFSVICIALLRIYMSVTSAFKINSKCKLINMCTVYYYTYIDSGKKKK